MSLNNRTESDFRGNQANSYIPRTEFRRGNETLLGKRIR